MSKQQLAHLLELSAQNPPPPNATPPVLPATSTTLVVTSAGSPITTLAHGGVITLTATVVKGGAR